MNFYIVGAPRPYQKMCRVYQKAPTNWDGHQWLDTGYELVPREFFEWIGFYELPEAGAKTVMMVEIDGGRPTKFIVDGPTVLNTTRFTQKLKLSKAVTDPDIKTIQDVWDWRRAYFMEMNKPPDALLDQAMDEAKPESTVWNRDTGDNFRLFNVLITNERRLRR